MKLGHADIDLLMAALERRVDSGDKKAEELYIRLFAEKKSWTMDENAMRLKAKHIEAILYVLNRHEECYSQQMEATLEEATAILEDQKASWELSGDDLPADATAGLEDLEEHKP